MADDIKPARTPEEWATLGWPYVATGIRSDGTWGVDEERTTKHRHALAALALHGQPFGFTRKDVGALREAYAELDASQRAPEATVAALASLVDRIAALLPPEPTDG